MEIKKSENSGQLKKVDRRNEKELFDVENLAIIEHAFMGSSSNVNGKAWNSEEIKKYLRNENRASSRKQLLTPIAFLKRQRDIGDISKERLKKRKLTGMICMFDINQQIELSEQKIMTYIELGEVSSRGEISGEWRVGLINESNSEVDSSELKLEPYLSEYFTLAKEQNGKGKILKFNLE